MDGQLLFLIIQIAFLIGAYLIGKSIPKETMQDVAAKIEIIIQFADKFVSWAKYFMKDATGSEKMAEVVRQLKGIAESYDIDVSEEQLTAIAQKAYDTMKTEDTYNTFMRS